MSTTTEVDLVAELLYGRLNGDATLLATATGGIADMPAPQGSTYPLVGYQLTDSRDVPGVGVSRVMTRQEWVVKGVTEGETYDRVIADRIDLLLDGVSTVAAGVTVTISRLASVRYPELYQGKSYRHLGGRYLIIAHT